MCWVMTIAWRRWKEVVADDGVNGSIVNDRECHELYCGSSCSSSIDASILEHVRSNLVIEPAWDAMISAVDTVES